MTSKTSVMIVEDEALLLMDTVMTVEDLGFAIHSECATLKEAFNALDDGVPDVALLDINIKRDVVWPVARRLRAAGSKIVFISADRGHKELKTEFAKCAFIEKPASANEIEGAIKERVMAD